MTSLPIPIGIRRINNSLELGVGKPAGRDGCDSRTLDLQRRVVIEPTVLNAERKEACESRELPVCRQAVVAPCRAKDHEFRHGEIVYTDQAAVFRPRKQLFLEEGLRLLGCFLGEIAALLVGEIRTDRIFDGRDDWLRGLHRLGRILK